MSFYHILNIPRAQVTFWRHPFSSQTKASWKGVQVFVPNHQPLPLHAPKPSVISINIKEHLPCHQNVQCNSLRLCKWHKETMLKNKWVDSWTISIGFKPAFTLAHRQSVNKQSNGKRNVPRCMSYWTRHAGVNQWGICFSCLAVLVPSWEDSGLDEWIEVSYTGQNSPKNEVSPQNNIELHALSRELWRFLWGSICSTKNGFMINSEKVHVSTSNLRCIQNNQGFGHISF